MRLPPLLLACLLPLAAALLPDAPVQARELLLGLGPRYATDATVPATSASFGVRLALFDLRSGSHDFELGLLAAPSGVEAAAGWRHTLAAGPLGNLIIEARAGYEAAGYGLALGARGVLGPVALRLELDLGTRGGQPFGVLLRAAPSAPSADLRRLTAAPASSASAGLNLGASWRPDRNWWLELNPRLALTRGGWALSGQFSVRRSGLLPELDFSAHLEAASALSGTAAGGHLNIGLSLHHVPRRAPESRLTLWWGWGRQAGAAESSWWPGIELATTVRDGAVSSSLTAGWVPNRADRAAAYLALGSSGPLASGRWLLNGRWAQGEGGGLELAWSRGF